MIELTVFLVAIAVATVSSLEKSAVEAHQLNGVCAEDGGEARDTALRNRGTAFQIRCMMFRDSPRGHGRRGPSGL